jgi:hypothetical protein
MRAVTAGPLCSYDCQCHRYKVTKWRCQCRTVVKQQADGSARVSNPADGNNTTLLYVNNNTFLCPMVKRLFYIPPVSAGWRHKTCHYFSITFLLGYVSNVCHLTFAANVIGSLCCVCVPHAVSFYLSSAHFFQIQTRSTARIIRN